MSALDRAVEAAERELDVREMVLTDPLTLRRLQAKRIARAVLMAVRDPDPQAVLNGQTAWDEVRTDSPYAAWVTMIDHILSEPQP